jgi:hypothetical protein
MDMTDRLKVPIVRAIISALVINIVFTVCLGSYFEAYEGVFSSMVSGMYTAPCLHEWFNDVHFLLFPVYAYVNQFFPNVPGYGVVLICLNNIALLLTGIALFKSLERLIPANAFSIFLALYLFISLENLLNLSTNRIVFYLFLGVCWNNELLAGQPDSKRKFLKFFLWLAMLVACLLRYEVVLICSVVYIGIMFVLKRTGPAVFIPLALGVSVLIAYNIYLSRYAPEAKRVSIIRELQFVDRNDVEWERLPGHLASEVEAFKRYGTMDEIHFNWNFYDSVSIKKDDASFFKLLGGVNAGSFFSILNTSVIHIKNIWYIVLFIVLPAVILLKYERHPNYRYRLLLPAILLLPVVMCLYELVPARIVVPFYSILLMLNFLFMLQVTEIRKSRLYFFGLAVLLMFTVKNVYESRLQYLHMHRAYRTAMEKLNELTKPVSVPEQHPAKLFIYQIQLDKFFPVCATSSIAPHDITFVNFYYFASYTCYLEYWDHLGVKNPLSLLEKMIYVAENKSMLVATEESVGYSVAYLKNKYGITLTSRFIDSFDKELNIYRLSYARDPD